MRKQQQIRTRHRAAKSRLAAFLLAATAVGGGLSAFATTYTWTGGGTANQDGSYNWNDTANWSVPTSDTDDTPITPTVAPTASDTTIIDTGSAVTVTCASGDYFGTLTVNRAVTFTGQAAVTKAVSGSGTITFDAFTFRKTSNDSGDSTVSNDVVVNNNVIMANHYTGESNVITFSGNVSGSGNLLVEANNKNNGCGFCLTGTANTFAGRFRGCNTNNGIRDGSRIANSDCSSEDAVYELGYTSNAGGCVLQTTDGTVEGAKTDYKFGALSGLTSGFSLAGTKNLTLTIGNRNDVISTLSIKSSWSGTANTINKVGSGEMQLAASVATLNVNAGTVTLTDSANVPVAIAMADGTTLGFADDAEFTTSFITPAGATTIDVAAGKSVTLVDAFDALTKTGAGTLILTTVPTGAITVSAGYVYLPANAEPTLNTETTGSVSTTAGLMLFNKNDVNVWTGAVNDNTWATGGNWSKGTAPSSFSEVVIIPETADDTLTITGGSASFDYTGVLTINRDVTLTGRFYIGSISGDATLTVDEVVYKKYDDSSHGDYVINCPLNVVNSFKSASYTASSNGDTLVINGKLTGTGTITQNGQSRVCCQFSGDTSEFAGNYYNGSNAQYRDNTQFKGAARGSALATWRIGCTGNSNGETSWPFQVSDTTYYFGRLDGATNFRLRPATGATAEVGALAGYTSTVNGTLYSDSNTLRKVGDTSTLNLTLTSAKGAVEAEAGTLYLKGGTDSAYAPVSCTITGKGATVVVEDAVANSTLTIVEDDPETEENEYSETGTKFAPVLSAELAAKYVLGSNTADGYTTYAIKDVCQVGEETFQTLDEAKAALTTENDTIVLLCSTPDSLTLAGGESVKIDATENAYTIGGVTGTDIVSSSTTEGTVTTYSAEDGVASVATSSGANVVWYTSFDAAYTAALSINNPQMVVKVGADFAPENITANKAFYKLTFVATTEDPITIDLSNGTYQMNAYRLVFPENATVNAVTYDYTDVSGGTLNIPEGVTFCYVPNNLSVTAITGTGTFKVTGVTDMGTSLPAAIQTMLRKSTDWNGTLEIANSTITKTWSVDSYANTKSSIKFNNVTTYLNHKNDTITIKGIEIAGDSGLTINGGYSGSSSNGWVFDCALTGTGPLVIDTNNGSRYKNVWFKGDVTGYAGSVSWGSSAAGTRLVFGNPSSFEANTNCLLVDADADVVVAAGATWTVPAGMYVYGKLTVNGTLDTSAATPTIYNGADVTIAADATWTIPTGGAVVHGNLTVNGAVKDTADAVGKIYSNTGTAVVTAGSATACQLGNVTYWRGTYVIGWGATSALNLNSYGNAYTTVALASDFGSGGYFTEAQTINPTVRLDADVTIKNGSARTEDKKSEKLVTFTKLTGGAGKTLTTFATGNVSAYMWYAITTLDKFDGSIALSNRSYMDIGTVNVATAPVAGTCVVPITVGSVGGVTGDLNLTVDGIASTDKLVFATVGETSGLYLAVASVDGTYYATLQAAVDAAGVSGATVAVTEALTSNISISVPAGSSISVTLPTGSTGTITANKVTTTVGSETVDITSYYTAESLAVDDGKIEPKLANSVQVGFADGESTEAAVVTVEEGSVKSTFTLPGTNVKKGLYYGVGTVTDPDETVIDVVAEKQATADGETISLSPVTLDFGTGNVLYYKWSVSDTPQVATP